MTPKPAPEKQHWLTRPRTIRLLWWWGGAVLAILTLADLIIHGHPAFDLDGTFGFYSWYGFVTCAGMVLFAKALGAVLKREDTYYERP